MRIAGNRIASATVLALLAGAAWPQSFEVASVKLSRLVDGPEGSGRASMDVAPDRLILRRYNVLAGVMWAYGVKEYQVAGPDWIATEKYEITGKAPAPVSRAEMRMMLRSLLAERFQLALHREQKDMAVYALVAAKNGPKMRKAEADGESGMKILGPGLRVSFTGQPIADLAEFLSGLLVVGRPVLDMSGITGSYSFDLDLNEAAKPGAEAKPSMTTVLQEQLGLRLEARRSAVEVLVIDRVEKPSGN